MTGLRYIAAALVLASIGCAELPVQTADNQPLAGGRLRVMAGNLTSGSSPSYNDGAGVRIFQGVGPDVALVQELKYTAGPRAFVDTAFGPEFAYTMGVGSIPNAVVSRYPILESGEWDDPQVNDRGFTWARIDVPGTTDLWAISVHLLTRSSSARDAEARSIVAQIDAIVPDGDWVVIGGDFNTDSRTEAALRTFSNVTVTSSPYPADHKGDGDTNASRGKPYDWVLASPTLDAREVPVVLGGSTFSHGLVVDTRVYSPITELAPARTSDSGAANMQHMGVVRDFDIPTLEEPTTTVHVDAPNGGEQWTIGSTQVIRWTAEGVESVDVEYAADGVTFQPIATGLAASDGAYTWTVPGPATTSARVRVVGGSVSDACDAVLSIVDAPTAPGEVLVNEILANEVGTATAGEFIELVNTDAAAADLSGWTLADATGVRHRFPAGSTLAPGARLVVYGNTASTGTLSLNNGGDTVKLADASGAVVESLTFTSAPDGVSFNRSADATPGPLVLHTTLSSALSSAGTAP